MTDKAKNTTIGILVLISSLLMSILLFRQPKVVTSVKTLQKTVYVVASATITGATNVTTHADGTIIASGTNVTIVEHSTSTTTVTEKETLKYNTDMIFAEARYNLDGLFTVGLGAKLSTFVVGLEYAPIRRAWGVSAGIVVLSWLVQIYKF